MNNSSDVSAKGACQSFTTRTAKFWDIGFKTHETAEDRVTRLYQSDGGPLVGWLLDEARIRNLTVTELGQALGVTSGYIAQLRAGHRSTSTIGHAFAKSCADFLGVPTVVVFLVSGFLTMADFAVNSATETEVLERALKQVQDDPHVRASIPVDLMSLSFEAKKAVVLLYCESVNEDLFRLRQLPETLRWLQRAALIHDENEFEAIQGHRDTSAP